MSHQISFVSVGFLLNVVVLANTTPSVELKYSFGEPVGDRCIGLLGDSCPTWMEPLHSDPNCCVCSRGIGEAVLCYAGNVSLESGFCMTYDSTDNTTYLAECPYSEDISITYHNLPRNRSELNQGMCHPLKRRGRVCGRCKPGYGPAVFSADVNCYRCSGPYHGWLLYFVFELVPVTIIFWFIMIFQCRGSQGSINGFLFFSQMAVYVYLFHLPEGSYPFGHTSLIVIRVFQVVYGLSNLDFFRQVVPPFCISENVTGLTMIALFYVAVVYLILLSVLSYVLIEMHARNCRLLVWLWRPLHKYYVKICRNVNPQTTLIDAFAMSLVFSYSRLLFISSALLHPTKLVTPEGKGEKLAPYFDGSIDYFSPHHLPYVLLSTCVIIVFNILPIVFLCVYPTKAFQKLLGVSCLKKFERVLRTFADAFQGCYRNGTDGKCDCRYFAGFYLLLRLITCVGNLIGAPRFMWVFPCVIFLITALLFANIRPYRNDIYNTMDSIWFSLGTAYTVCQVVIVASGVESSRHYQITLQIMLGIPLAYIVCYILHVYYCIRRSRGQHSESEDTAGVRGDQEYRLLEETA